VEGKHRRAKERRSLKYMIGSLRGTSSLFRKNIPLPLVKGKGKQGMGLINNLLGGKLWVGIRLSWTYRRSIATIGMMAANLLIPALAVPFWNAFMLSPGASTGG
jgi:hypothetical protein